MSAPITADRFATLVRSAGIPHIFHEGWRTRNRNEGRQYGPVNGVMLHHTVTQGLRTTIRLVRDQGQSSEVPAPLYNGVVDKEGILHVIGWGRVNHAGKGDQDVFRAVIAEDVPPAPNEASVDGNRYFYGFAGINLGDQRDPWPTAQLETLGAVAGLICREHGWTRNSIIGHREWQPGKVDPRGPQGDLMPRLRGIAHLTISK